jgi:hypothetical protein
MCGIFLFVLFIYFFSGLASSSIESLSFGFHLRRLSGSLLYRNYWMKPA